MTAQLLRSRQASAGWWLNRDWVRKALAASSAMAARTSYLDEMDVLRGIAESQLGNNAEPDALASCHGAGIHVEGGSREAVSPVVHVRVAEQPKDAAEAEAALQQVVSTALRKSGVLLSVNRMSKLDAVKGGPSIRCGALLQCAHVHAADLLGRTPVLACTGRLSPVKAEQSASTHVSTMMWDFARLYQV